MRKYKDAIMWEANVSDERLPISSYEEFDQLKDKAKSMATVRLLVAAIPNCSSITRSAAIVEKQCIICVRKKCHSVTSRNELTTMN